MIGHTFIYQRASIFQARGPFVSAYIQMTENLKCDIKSDIIVKFLIPHPHPVFAIPSFPPNILSPEEAKSNRESEIYYQIPALVNSSLIHPLCHSRAGGNPVITRGLDSCFRRNDREEVIIQQGTEFPIPCPSGRRAHSAFVTSFPL